MMAKVNPIVEGQSCPGTPCWKYFCSSSNCRDRTLTTEKKSWDYFKCSACGTLQIDEYTPVDDVYQKERVPAVYHKPHYLVRCIHAICKPLKKIYSTLDFSGMKILDVGCGNGQKLYNFYKRNAEQVYGIDFSNKKVDVAKKYMPEGHFFIGYLSDSTFPKEHFDFVIADNVLEHIPDADQFVRELLSYVKAGGSLVLHVPYAKSWSVKYFKQNALNIWPPFHINLFTSEYFKLHFPDLSFRFIKKSYFLNLRQTFLRNAWNKWIATFLSLALLPFAKEELIIIIDRKMQ